MTTEHLPKSARRVQLAADALGLEIAINLLEESTRTAEEAAAACGCSVAQIIKSLIFRSQSSGAPLLFLVSGANRVHEKRTGQRIGETLARADADFVRTTTGYAIGGVPPFGHATRIATYVDKTLLEADLVWAAAGTPRSLFSINPRALVEKTNPVIIDVT